MSKYRGTEDTFARMAKEKMIGDVLREDASKKLSIKEGTHEQSVEVDELGREMTPFRRFQKWHHKVFKGY
jgi:hypothetical protein